MSYGELVKLAFDARKYSYSPYSDFMVGAALLCKDGKVFQGCNIESSSYTPTCCAERTAFVKAVSEGYKEFEAIAIVGAKKNSEDYDYCYPCGVCRQVMLEFCGKDFQVIVAKSEKNFKAHTLSEIIPFAFNKLSLK